MKVLEIGQPGKMLCAIAADRLDRAAFHGFFAEIFFIRAFGLFEHVGMSPVVVSCEIGRCGFTAEIAIDALVVYIKFSNYVFRIFVC